MYCIALPLIFFSLLPRYFLLISEMISLFDTSALQKFVFWKQGDTDKWPIYEIPDTSSHVMEHLEDGMVVKMLRSQGDWLFVRHGDKTGWTVPFKDDVRYLQLDMSIIVDPTWYRVTTAAGAHGLALRSSPNSCAVQIGQVYVGERVLAHRREKDWLLVDTMGAQGVWVQVQKAGVIYLTADKGNN